MKRRKPVKAGYKGNYPGTEYTGEMRDNILPAKNPGDFLPGSDVYRLFKMTGQTTDPTVPRDERVWAGLAPKGKSAIDFTD
jgi:hypothetical protein